MAWAQGTVRASLVVDLGDTVACDRAVQLHDCAWLKLLMFLICALDPSRLPIAALQDFMLPALLYLTVRNPPWYVWVLNISIAVIYFAVAVLGSVGAVRFIVIVRPYAWSQDLDLEPQSRRIHLTWSLQALEPVMHSCTSLTASLCARDWLPRPSS